jgi:exopolysaccharide biosynthesis polyprenyl glycosylphosphotransferase
MSVKSSIFGFVQRLADFLTVVASFCLGYWYYYIPGNKSVTYSFLEFTGLGAFAGLVFLVVFHSFRLYENKSSLLNVVETKRLMLGCALGSLLILGFTFYFRFLDLSRIMMTVSLIISFLLLLMQRSFLYNLHLLARVRAGAARPVLIYGAGVVGRHLYKRIYHSPGLRLSVAGFLDDDTRIWGKDVQITEVRRKNGNIVIGGLDRLERLIREKGVKEVFVALPNATYQRNLEIVNTCRKAGLSVSVVPPTYGHKMHNIEVEDIGGIPILREKENQPYFFYPFLKRVFDLVVSLFIISLLSPLFIVLALVVRFDSAGPIIFRQRRVGLNGKEFDFYKFRTMHANANPYAITPNSPSDPRITRFGKWLRRSSLDELPQFWNVLNGDMSLVGPRPEMPFIVAEYTEEQRERLKVKPGITGVWQISAVRGEPIHANLEYDLFYIEHRSVLLDLIIMARTLITAIRGIGAV